MYTVLSIFLVFLFPESYKIIIPSTYNILQNFQQRPMTMSHTVTNSNLHVSIIAYLHAKSWQKALLFLRFMCITANLAIESIAYIGADRELHEQVCTTKHGTKSIIQSISECSIDCWEQYWEGRWRHNWGKALMLLNRFTRA